MRTIEEIHGALKRWKIEEIEAENLMESALKERSEFAYSVHLEDLKKAQHYIEMLEYVLVERD